MLKLYFEEKGCLYVHMRATEKPELTNLARPFGITNTNI
jgi:hypothetical protein